MANVRKVEIYLRPSVGLCIVSDGIYDDGSEALVTPLNIITGGMGEWSIEQNLVDLTNAAARIKLVHNSGQVMGEFAYDDILTFAIDGADQLGTATNLGLVVEACAPYLFSNGGGGFTYSLTRTITSAEIKAAQPATGLAQGLVLATAPAGKQFEWRIRWRLDAGATAYTAGGDIQIKIGSIVVAALDVESVTSSTDRSHSIAAGYSIGEYKIPSDGEDILIFSPSGEFLDGDGTITVTLLYNLF